MKKLVVYIFILLFVTGASAQAGPRRPRVSANLSSVTTLDHLRLQRDIYRYQVAERNACRDGRYSAAERKRLIKMKSRVRRQAFRSRHNGRNRVI